MLKRLKYKSLLVTLVSALIIIGVISVSIWYYRADPLVDDGVTTYTDIDGNYHVYTIMLINKSRTDINIQSVTVNGKMKPDLVQLGISYNTGHQVQFMGEKTDPATTFMDVHNQSIRPQLSSQKIRTIIENKANSNQKTPIYYGIAIRFDQQPLEEVTIRYTYLGLTKEKHITRWFE
ncbi:hypothetical protein [Paenibacillus sp. CF384]|uniref:hypothetical protein n=1 Tax=Paenibacillus sp. CF384 TaxID=1884382 RepID=UPI0008978791|nr:hypothetical protein [Paenibacillus sp. CF384]SDX05341.1 hypothetical protein SAMN05518855_100873 [Paenibacillus sp. CF384]